jgi:DNA-binding NarL/FixJ family response regulator
MLRVMIVDDFVPLRKVVKDMLSEEIPSAEIVEAGDGRGALSQLTPFPPDFILMDIRLPDENGLDLTRKIKAGYPDTTVGILTSYDLPEYRETAAQSGASCFIVKGSMKLEGISTMIKCFDKAKNEGRQRPTCVRLTAGNPGKNQPFL